MVVLTHLIGWTILYVVLVALWIILSKGISDEPRFGEGGNAWIGTLLLTFPYLVILFAVIIDFWPDDTYCLCGTGILSLCAATFGKHLRNL